MKDAPIASFRELYTSLTSVLGMISSLSSTSCHGCVGLPALSVPKLSSVLQQTWRRLKPDYAHDLYLVSHVT